MVEICHTQYPCQLTMKQNELAAFVANAQFCSPMMLSVTQTAVTAIRVLFAN